MDDKTKEQPAPEDEGLLNKAKNLINKADDLLDESVENLKKSKAFGRATDAFKRADDYVEKKEYQRALEEIRRIYIIEPGSIVAKEYEQKIEQLAALHTRNELQAATSAEIKETKADVKEPKGEVKKSKKSDPVIEPPKEKVVLQPEETSKKSKLPILIAAAVVVILAIGAWIFFSRGSSTGAQTNQEQTQPPSPMQDSVIIPSPTTTSAPQSGKGSIPIAEISKQPVKIEKKQPEVKSIPQGQKPAQPVVTPPVTTPATTQPTNSKPQAGQPPSATPTQQPAQQPNITESTPAPMPFVAIENPPEIIRREPAKYPEIAIKMGIQGRVTVEVTVDVQGKPIQTKVVKSSSDVFNDAAVEAVMKYTFKPAMQSTGPVTAKVYIPIDFRLK